MTGPAGTIVLPVSLPIGDVFGDHSWTGSDGARHHRCWFCAPQVSVEPYVKVGYPPMPPGCTLCACCGVLIFTNVDDPGNEEMAVCRPCEQQIAQDLTADSHADSPAGA